MTDQKPFKFQFFLPEARVMSDQEVAGLPADKTRSSAAAGGNGLWIEVSCPDRSCLTADGKLTIPTEQSAGKGVFLNMFCPEDTCEIVEATDVP